MSFLLEEVPTKSNSKHTLWVEKYRPAVLDDYIGNDQLRETVKSFIDKGDVPHLLFYGSAGGGKTALAKLITKNISCDVLYINSSDETGVDNVRGKIKGFASTSGFNKLKIIILDESDFLSTESQAALRNLMETFSLTTRFILTCNYHEKIISPIISRCQTFEIIPPSKKAVAIHLNNILDMESVEHTMEDIGYIVNTYYPDIRKILNFAQQSSLGGKIKISSDKSLASDLQDRIISILKSGSLTAFAEIRQLIADNDISMFDEYYSLLYRKVSEYSKNKDVAVIMTIAEYLHQSCLVVDKEITFMACIGAILKTIK